MAGKTSNEKAATLTIQPPNMQVAVFRIRGVAPYVQNKFSAKAREQMREKHEAGSTAKKNTKREAKDFEQCYQGAIHKSSEGWIGLPAPAFRNAMISACRMCGFQMTRAKLAVFVLPDGFDETDGQPLVKFVKGEPVYHETYTRNETGVVDLRPRPMWHPGWEADVRVQFDADQFTLQDVANLLLRAGIQVGIGEGRPDSKKSAGMGWGLFEIVDQG